jgi:predicted nucleotidyltransferase
VSGYPLSGIREATTERQLQLLEHAVEVLRADERIHAAWLAGSFATGEADPWSDLDIHCLVDDELAEAFAGEGWKDVLAAITPTVMATSFPPGTVGGYALTPDWIHLDLVFRPRSSFAADRHAAGARALFDRIGALDDLPAAPPVEVDPWFPKETVDWFFYMLGNIVTVVGRDDAALAMLGVLTVRDTCLVPLFLAERGIQRRGGVKRLNHWLSQEQRAVLESLPPLVATVDSVVDAQLHVARIFIERGRALAARLDADWPDELESATLRHVENGLGISSIWT